MPSGVVFYEKRPFPLYIAATPLLAVIHIYVAVFGTVFVFLLTNWFLNLRLLLCYKKCEFNRCSDVLFNKNLYRLLNSRGVAFIEVDKIVWVIKRSHISLNTQAKKTSDEGLRSAPENRKKPTFPKSARTLNHIESASFKLAENAPHNLELDQTQHFHHNNQSYVIYPLIPDLSKPLSRYMNLNAVDSTEFRLLNLRNELKAPRASFISLLSKNLMAPFFVFQLFSNLLWCYDEYFYHGLFSIFMQFTFELGVCFARIQALKMFGKSDIQTSEVWLVQSPNDPNFSEDRIESEDTRKDIPTDSSAPLKDSNCLKNRIKSEDTRKDMPTDSSVGIEDSNSSKNRIKSEDTHENIQKKARRSEDTVFLQSVSGSVNRGTLQNSKRSTSDTSIAPSTALATTSLISQNESSEIPFIRDCAEFAINLVNSVNLFPGDLIAITTPGIQVPCDLLILKGACSVNEAMLTGESIPLHKEDISECDAFKNLCLDRHKRHILFGGTELIKINEISEIENDRNSSTFNPCHTSQIPEQKMLAPNTPIIGTLASDTEGHSIFEGGSKPLIARSPSTSTQLESFTLCSEYSHLIDQAAAKIPKDKPFMICCVLNTGFNTTQGKLIQKMIQSEEVSVESKEAYLFIACLLVFALIGCFILIFDYFQNKRFLYKPRKKMIVELIFLLTNVVPSELPIELSLAINSALQCLMKVGVFCLEPFRIPLCGKVDVCCFDKTGTLTETDLTVKLVITAQDLERIQNNDQVAIKNQSNCGNATINDSKTNGCDSKAPSVLRPAAKKSLKKVPKGVQQSGHPRDFQIVESNHTVSGSCQPIVNFTADTQNEKSAASLEQMILSASTCHSLVKTTAVLGDPMETSILQHFQIQLLNDTTAYYNNIQTQIIKRWAFTSELKRMTVIGEYKTVISDNSNTESRLFEKRLKKPAIFVCMKGAPETVSEFLSEKPKNYDIYLEYAKQGYRVISLAFKPAKNRLMSRESAECDLQFVGFVVYECKIKNKAVETIQELVDSGIKVVMITGDNLLTAVAVSKTLGIIQAELDYDMDNLSEELADHTVANLKNLSDEISQKSDNLPPSIEKITNLHLTNDDGSHDSKDSTQTVKVLRNDNDDFHQRSLLAGENLSNPSDREFGENEPPNSNHSLCAVESDQIDEVLKNDDRFDRIKVFARASPDQKEAIIRKYKVRKTVLMCGDGTNDVGALKAAHVGVALVEPKKLAKKPAKKQNTPLKNRAQMTFSEKLNENLKKAQENQDRSVQLGDASVAAPFTSKTTLDSITNIIKQGRSTLATTLQMHKILALNCIITAFSLSILDLKGIKYGETQMVISGILIAFAFMFITRSKTHSKISKKKPIDTVFCRYVVFSILLQTIIHIISFILLLKFINKNEIYSIEGFGMKSGFATGKEDVLITKITQEQLFEENEYLLRNNLSVEEFTKRYDDFIKFRPSTLNSAIFLLSTTQQIGTFIINYIGKPFRESLFENTHLRNSLGCVSGICIALIIEIYPGFSRFMEIVPLGNLRFVIGAAVILDFSLCFLVERLCFKRFIK